MTTAVVTGLGVLAPNGMGVEECWAATLAGKTGIRPISGFDASRYSVTVAGELAGFHAVDRVPRGLIVQTDKWTQHGLVCTEHALADAAVDTAALDEYEMAVVTASSSGGNEFGQREIQRLWEKGPEFVGAYQSIAWFYAATTGQVSIRHGMRGPCGVVATEQAGGLDAIGQARRLIRAGTPVIVTGGTDASLCPYGLVAQTATGRLSTRSDPERAYLPFDADACGHVVGEGGAIAIVEDLASAVRRGAPRRYGEIAGYAATFDPPPGSPRPPGLRRAAEAAMADAGVAPDEVDVVFADAAGVPALDRAEAAAITGIFGPHGVPVTAPKTMTGRLLAGGAALDVAFALLAIRDSVVPPTVGVRRQAGGHHLDLVLNEPREARVRTALVLARGHGGFNSAMVVRQCGTE
ncbi:ketosynthase chain-length factor [Amycolatopsis tolypomycina]|uniref:ketosynthase chain-length factor n=1 Tax=Amycolatopsis tolypomycina TaxID=208445 RepID=UPI0033B77529